jgi:hypothetical protein
MAGVDLQFTRARKWERRVFARADDQRVEQLDLECHKGFEPVFSVRHALSQWSQEAR